MKRNKFNILTGAILVFALFFGSCETWIDPEVNLSKNSPVDVPMALLLPSTQVALFYVLGGDHSRAASVFMQHQGGVDRQAAAWDVYTFTESDVNNLFNTLNATVMQNLVTIRTKAVAQRSPHFEGVANVLTAFTLGEMTDVWGDIPFYEAHRANITGNITPRYDSQQRIYVAIDSLLVAAIAQLQVPTSVFSPTAVSDLIYRGDRDRWRRAAWTLRLRYALHLSERRGTLSDVIAILENPAAMFITTNIDDFQFVFGIPATEAGARRNFEVTRGDIRAGRFIVDLMNATADPRRAAYFTLFGGAFVGSGPGEYRFAASRMGPFYSATNSPVPVLTNVERLFITAEVRFRQGGAANLALAATAFNDGVRASLDKHGITLTVPAVVTWLAANAAETGATITLDKIMTAKYIGLYLQTQVWSDWRRTGIPVLPLAAGAVLPEIPRRFPYSVNERLYNPNMPAGLTMLNRVWWDMQ